MDGLFDLPGAADSESPVLAALALPPRAAVGMTPTVARYSLPSGAEQSPALDQLRGMLANAGYVPTPKVYWTPDKFPAGTQVHLDLSAVSYLVTFGNTVDTQQTPQGIYDQYHAQGALCSYIEVWENDQTIFGLGDIYFGFLAVHS